MRNAIPLPSSSRLVPDAQLVLQAQQGDTAAFAELVGRHYRYCLRIAIGIVQNEADAEDEVQNAFVSAFLHLVGFENRSSFRSWLTRIVTNQCFQRHRKLRRVLSLAEGMDSLPEAGVQRWHTFADGSKTAEQRMMDSQMGALAFACLQQLPPLFRHVFHLYVVDDLPLAAVCEQLHITPAAAKSRLCRARAELRRRMQPHFTSGRPVLARRARTG